MEVRSLYKQTWGNGAEIEVVFHPDALPGEDPSDRIQMFATPARKETRGWLMNVEDAVAVIHGLTLGIQECVFADVPSRPYVADRSML